MTSSYLVTPGDFTQAGIALASLLVYFGRQRLGMKREAAQLNTPHPSWFMDERYGSARPHHHALSVAFAESLSQEAPKWHYVMAMTVIMTLPILVMYFPAQRYVTLLRA